MLDSGMINKIQKAKMYADEPERIHFTDLRVEFDGTNNAHAVEFGDGCWRCDCDYFSSPPDVQPRHGARPDSRRDGAARERDAAASVTAPRPRDARGRQQKGLPTDLRDRWCFRISSRGGNRTRDPGIMSAVL